jgi:hypothetical protein
MDEATTNDNWADRQRAKVAGFDAIGTRYDEVGRRRPLISCGRDDPELRHRAGA